jgi:formylglycine-generating enzyme required for sulfatase activity
LLERIRSEARPPTEAELAADRASHPKGKELETKRAELIWTSRMLGLEPWPSEAEVEASLAREGESADAGYLNDRAWNLVDPDARVLGREIEALVLARRAVDSAQDNSRARYRDTLAWALLWAGMIDEALAEEQRAIEEVDPEERADFERYLLRMDGEAQPFRDGTAHGRQQTLVAEVSALEQEVAERQAFHFADREKEWWNMQLGGLLQDLEELGKRILLAERSVGSPAALQQWNEAIEAIARSPKYSGLRLTPQLELVPLGPDPDSGLWEFAHLATGEPARRGTDGFLLKPETGIVFVLLPAGRAPVENGSKPRPMNEVLLDPFFLSKYEMTVAQWQRTSHWTEGFWLDRPLLPASGVSWDDCVATLTRAGLFLRLPTEAQWEYGCRAGTTTVWWTGAEEETLWGAANIDFDPEDDEEVELERVGQLLANPFGLHDVHGNVAEWCRDEYCLVDAVVRAGDGEFAPRGARNRVARGGGFPLPVSLARSGGRLVLAPDSRTVDMAPPIRTQLGENIAFESRGGVGLRVARGITP